jgi:putative endopeptidase
MRIRLSAALAASVLLAATPIPAQMASHGVDASAMDTSADRCTNFYEYADGAWLKKNPIPADRPSWNSFSEVEERNRAILREIAESAAAEKDAPAASPGEMVGAFYRSGMDEKKIETEGVRPIQPELDRIAAIHDRATLLDELARLHRESVRAGFGLRVRQDYKDSTKMIAWVYQSGLGLPDRDYYVKDDAKTKEIRNKYVAHVQRMFELLEDPAGKAAAEAKTVMELETHLAKVSMTRVEQRDPKAIYHPMMLVGLEALAPEFSWRRYFTDVGLPEPGLLSVGQPEFVKEEGRMIADVPLSDWQAYLRWRLIDGVAEYLSRPFVEEDFDFSGKVIRGTKELEPRWKRVIRAVDENIGEALGQLFVARAFPPQAKQRAIELVGNLEASLKDRIEHLDWMGEATKKQALGKLDAIMVKVGYPDRWRDYTGLSIDDSSYVGNVLRAAEFEFKRRLDKIGKPIDRTEWGMTPPTVNAYYNPGFNEIVFPAGILQRPFFDAEADDASNYGGIGTVIGHEITHGFDDQGRQFDAQGNLRDWWTSEDGAKYDARAKGVEQQFDAYVPIENVHINGKLTLGENIADLGGLKIAHNALHRALSGKPRAGKLGGFTPEQHFFLSYAQVWKLNIRPEALRLQLATNPHSPGPYRVQGPISNLPEFAKAFGCPAPPAGRPEIW